MDIRKLQRAIVDGLEDVKAQNIVVFNTEHLSPLFERVIIASGTSNRQTKALAASVRDAVKTRGLQVMRTEGEDNGEWIIVDCGAAVAHIMQPAIREYYHLEEIWGGKPVKLKLDGGTAHLPKAEGADEDDDEAQAAPAAKKPAAKKATAKTTTAGKGAKAPAKTVASAPAKKSAAKAGAKKAVTRTVGTKSTASSGSRSAPAKRAATAEPVKKVVVGAKTPARKTAARPTAAKKAPAKTASRTAPKAVAKAPARKAPAKKAGSRG
jgi:ribosome-associated protein